MNDRPAPPARPHHVGRSPVGDALGHGMDAMLVVVVFALAGYGLDRWLGTRPWLLLAMVLLAGVGLFFQLRYRYTEAMQRLEADRRMTSRRQGQAR